MNNLIKLIRSASYIEANSLIREICGIVKFFSSENEKKEFLSEYDSDPLCICEDRVTYGDWQTPQTLAEKVCGSHLIKFGTPDILIEPTCGKGAFISAALEKFPDLTEIHALEINRRYITELKRILLLNALSRPRRKYPKIYLYNTDFFEFDFSPIIKRTSDRFWNLAIIGNPPWVTNSTQGKNNSGNIPLKQNFYRLKGIEAITGKSNFDISEYITLKLIELSQFNKGGISFLLKNSVIRNIVSKQKIKPLHIGNLRQEIINASSEFNVSVDASCFSASFDSTPAMICRINDFYNKTTGRDYGWVGNSFVSNIEQYHRFAVFDNHSDYVWRSGIKHDCASVLELTRKDGIYKNGLGETVDIEEDLIYPLLKSSDIQNYRANKLHRYLIVTQHYIGEDTSHLKYSHPRGYAYLMKHENAFSRRKSTIYKGKDRFSIFGIGAYSFKPYKIVISSLYKSIKFLFVEQLNGKPLMVDDTCYQLDFDNEKEAIDIYNALCSQEIQTLLKSLVFLDSKRVVTKNLLMRLDLVKYCDKKGISLGSSHYKKTGHSQLSLFD